MRSLKFSVVLCGFILLLSCTQPQPRVVGENPTGAAVIVTPSTYGVTSITTPNGQVACTEPRPNASLESAFAGNANLSAEQVKALVDAQVAAGSSVGASAEFESVEFLAHGLFGICQLASSGAIKEGEANALILEIIKLSAELEGSTEKSTNADEDS